MNATRTHEVVCSLGVVLGHVGDGLEGFEENGESLALARTATVEHHESRGFAVDVAVVVLPLANLRHQKQRKIFNMYTQLIHLYQKQKNIFYMYAVNIAVSEAEEDFLHACAVNI